MLTITQKKIMDHVLILVLVDDALWAKFEESKNNTSLVLILVLVDDALWVILLLAFALTGLLVLILVLVDDALWVNHYSMDKLQSLPS